MDRPWDLGLGRNGPGSGELRAFGGVQEPAVFDDCEAVGHAGDVVGHSAGAAVGAAGFFCDGCEGAVFGGKQVDVVEEGIKQLAHDSAGFGGHADHLVVAVEAVAQERHQLGVLFPAGVTQGREGFGL